MCQCTPGIRTPYCGRGTCVWPHAKPAGAREALYDQTVRDLFGELEGRRIVGLSQHDKDEFRETGVTRIVLHLDNGSTLSLIGNGDCCIERPDGTSTQIGLPDDDEDDGA